MLTVGDLLLADSRPFHRAALAWAALADVVDDAYEHHAAATDLAGRSSSGATAASAAVTLTATGRTISNTCRPARRIAEALQRHAWAVTDLRTLLQSVHDGVRANGLRLDWAAGQIFAPSTVSSSPSATPPSADEFGARAATALQATLVDILEKARRLDEQTAAVLGVNLPAAFVSTDAAVRLDRGAVARWAGARPADLHRWWLLLTPEQQEQVLHDDPELAGTFDGIPAADRDRANRVNLDHQLRELQQQEAQLREFPRFGAFAAALRHNLQTQAALRSVRLALDPSLLLLGVSADGDGRAIVAAGDPDTAAHVAVLVPGINTDLGDVPGGLDRTRNLRDAADLLTQAPNDVAVVYWLGYDPPGTDLGALSGSASRAGAATFVPFVDGLRASHADAQSVHVTAIGHSYGSTVVAEAALTADLGVDDIVTAGSPGMHTDHAVDLNIGSGHVWGAAAAGDPIAGFAGSLPGVHGQEPTDPAFGGNRYVVDTTGHSAYWTPGSVSLLNQARIVVGQYDRVSLQFGTAPAVLVPAT